MAESNNEQVMRDAQYRKGLSIAYFNSLNAAVELSKGFQGGTLEEQIQTVRTIRDVFINDHKEYYTKVIASVGVAYNVEEAIDKLKAVKNATELHTVWLMLSEDERRDPEISQVAQSMKESLQAS